METDGHLSETLMEERTTFRLVPSIIIHLQKLTVSMDGQDGQIQQVAMAQNNVKLFVQYLLITIVLIKKIMSTLALSH